MNDWLTTILIFLPMAGALLVWLLPLERQAVASLATLLSLVEVGVWIVAVERFDGRPVAETEAMPLLLEAGFLAGPRRAVLRP